MFDTTLLRSGLTCLLILLGTCCMQDALAQYPRQGQRGQPRSGAATPYGRQGQQQGQQADQEQEEESKPFISGVTVGIGIGAFLGDLDSNPNNNIIKHIGAANLDLLVGIDKRYGEFNQYGIGLQLSYDRITGQNVIGLQFSNNVLNLNLVGEYELPYIKQGLLRVFAGGGPALLISPSYTGFPTEDNEKYKALGTRVVGTVVVGVIIEDKFRIGTRIATTDFLDGHTGVNKDAPFDMIGFLNVGYRFNLAY